MDALGRPFFIGAITKPQKKAGSPFHVGIKAPLTAMRPSKREAAYAFLDPSPMKPSSSWASRKAGRLGPAARALALLAEMGEDQAALSAGKIFAPCMIPGTSTQKGRLPGKIHTLCIRNRPIAPRNECTGRRFCHLQREKHAFRANVAREAALFAQSARRGYMRHDSCHIGQNNLKDGHSKVMGRRSIGPKEDPRATAKSPSAKATPTRPSSLTARRNTQISLRPRRPHKSINPRG